MRDLNFADIRARGAIRAQDIEHLRQTVFADGLADGVEVDALLALGQACPVKDRAWASLIVDLIGNYLVHRAEPRGYVTAEKAHWLIRRLSPQGAQIGAVELELVIAILQAARWAPPSLSVFALDQVRSTIIEGTGPSRTGRRLGPGVVDSVDVTMLRRILCACPGEAVTTAEAHVLFEIDEATRDTPNAPEWTELFTLAITNVLLAASGYRVPPRHTALGKGEEWSANATLSFVARMATGGLRPWLATYQTLSDDERAVARLERQKIELVTNEVLAEGEAQWLAARLGRSGLSPNEKALIGLLRRADIRVDPTLSDLLARAA
jgi:hypothetical protein